MRNSVVPNLDQVSIEIDKVMDSPNISAIQKIQGDLEPHVSNLQEVKQNFSNLVHNYYRKNNPFKNCNTLTDYLASINEIIGLAATSGNYELIDRWIVEELNKAVDSAEVANIIATFSSNYRILKPGTWSYSEYLINRF